MSLFKIISFISFFLCVNSQSAIRQEGVDAPLKRDFAQLIQRVASRHEIDMIPVTHEWAFQLKKGGGTHSIFYYDFDINGSGAYQVCKDKATTSALLSRAGIPCVPHQLFISPSDSKYSPKTGVWPEIEKYANQFNYHVVCKPANGSGGKGVDKASTLLELETLYLQNLGNGQYDFYVSPAQLIDDEYRVVMLDDVPQLVYRKKRPEIVGDGSKILQELFLDYLHQLPAAAYKSFFLDFKGNEHEWRAVLAKDERYPLKWKHNLEQGGSADTYIEQAIKDILIPLAQRAMSALGVRFASVDMIHTKENEWKILEVNAGVMMKHFMAQNGEKGVSLAEAIYERAICKMFDLSSSRAAEDMYASALHFIYEKDKGSSEQ